MLAIALTTLFACADLCTDAAVSHYATLLAAGGYGRLPNERAAFLVRDRDGALALVRWPHSDFARASYRGRIPPGTIAIVHTHPRRQRAPSANDRQQARRLGLPVIVVTPAAVTIANSDGTTEEILSRAMWWKQRPARK